MRWARSPRGAAPAAAIAHAARRQNCRTLSASALEAHLETELAVRRVVERSEVRGAEVRLDIHGIEGVEDVVGAHADPGPPLRDAEAVLQAGVEAEVIREAL